MNDDELVELLQRFVEAHECIADNVRDIRLIVEGEVNQDKGEEDE